jgi:hypothetical protein
VTATLEATTSLNTTQPGEVYVRNMQALWQYDPRLAMALERLKPESVPPVERAKDGGWTVRLGSEPRSGLYLHSNYRPSQEAESWASTIPCNEKYAVVVCGYGLGYHVKPLFQRMPDDALLVVSEPNLPLLKAGLQCVDVSEILATGRVMIFTSLDRGLLVDRLEPRSVLFTAGEGTLFAVHPASMQIPGAAPFHTAFQKLITEFVSFTRTGFVTLMLNNVATCKNIANNLGRYATTPPVDLLHGAYKGKPAVLVAAGPSLAKNMHLLKELIEEPEARSREPEENSKLDTRNSKLPRGRRAVIIAVQTMLKPLLAAGIEPDFVTSLDYNTVSTRFFENIEESGSTGRVHLVAEAKANWNVLDVFGGGGTMSVIHNDFAAKLLRDTVPPRMGMKAGATVAHLSFYLAEFLGCDPIILTGQDLGFVDGLYYKPGTAIHETWGVELGRFNSLETKEWERIVRSRQILRKIPDIHGHPMYTEEQFFVYLQQFERDFATTRERGIRVIDATEGGAKKQHVEVMKLREAIDQFCEKPEARSQEPEVPAWKTWSCDVPAGLERTIAALEERRNSAADMKATCLETVPLLEQMIEKQSDAAEMDRLFVEVDRLRTKVGSDPATFEMVCFLNTIGELRRFQHDLTVKSAGDSMERQKRQLVRDIDYVNNLRVGAERLLDILDEAIARLRQQLEAARESRPWPRQVAGAKTDKVATR